MGQLWLNLPTQAARDLGNPAAFAGKDGTLLFVASINQENKCLISCGGSAPFADSIMQPQD
jgi:hypothetical protein